MTLLATVLCACASTAQIEEHNRETMAALEGDADALFVCLENEAETRNIPLARRDEARRRLTSDWIDETDDTRRRYFLSVLLYSAGLAIRVHIVREELQQGGEVETWAEIAPTDEVSAEETAIINAVHQRWEADGCGAEEEVAPTPE